MFEDEKTDSKYKYTLTSEFYFCLHKILDSIVKREEAVLFFNLTNQLHEKTSFISTTNKIPTEWVEILNDEVLSGALFGQLLYCCEVISSQKVATD